MSHRLSKVFCSVGSIYEGFYFIIIQFLFSAGERVRYRFTRSASFLFYKMRLDELDWSEKERGNIKQSVFESACVQKEENLFS